MGMSVGTTYRGNTLGSVWALLQGLDAEHCRDPPPGRPEAPLGCWVRASLVLRFRV